MDIERIATWRAFRPTCMCQVLPADHCAVALQEGLGQARLDGRQGHPTRAVAEDAVVVEKGQAGTVEVGSSLEPGHADAQVHLAGRHPYPVLQAVTAFRGPIVPFHEEQPRPPLPGQIGPTRRFNGPTKEYDVHARRR
jgi:hypothetical protein